MTVNEFINILEINTNINSNKKIKSIKTDSRLIEKGDVFIALIGKKYDGNNYVEEALKKGAIVCVTNYKKNNKCLVVNSTIEVLYKLGLYFRNKYNIPLVGITGSTGKTTTKDLISYLLSSKYNVLKNDDSKNNIIGISHTLFKLNDKHDIIVMEMGSNHIGEISYLSKLCKPDISIITNIGSSHLEYFKTKKNIYKEKISILDGMNCKKLILNGDDRYLKKLNYYKCGINKYNDLIAYDLKEEIDKISFKIYLEEEKTIIFNNPGIHFVSDILLAIKLCLDYDIDIDTIIERIKSFKITEKRMNLIKLKNNILIDDSYNASLESIVCGLNYLKNIKSDKLIILGDILELGKYSKKVYKKINKELKKIDNKKIITVGNNSKLIKSLNFKNANDLIEYLKSVEIYNKYIYIKGSRMMKLDLVVNYFKEKELI